MENEITILNSELIQSKITCEVYDVPIIDYVTSKVYCKGFFRTPNDQEKNTSSRIPFAVFQNIEKHGWKVWMYTKESVDQMISQSRSTETITL